jgi:hypothetical protein
MLPATSDRKVLRLNMAFLPLLINGRDAGRGR